MDNIIKYLENNTNNGLKALHDVFGFDFKAPYNIYYIAGRFTLKQVDKMINAGGHTCFNSVVAILSRDPRYTYSNKYHIARYTGYTGNIDIDYRIYRYQTKNYWTSLDTYCRKADFEEMRKTDAAETIIIAQKLDYIRITTPYKADYNRRFNIKKLDFDTCRCSNSDESYISRVYVNDLDYDGRRVTRDLIGRVFYTGSARDGKYKTDIEQLIDKSGYFVDEKREDLKRRANALRAERAKNAFKQTDNTALINSLYSDIMTRRNEIVTLLQDATTAADFEHVSKLLGYWCNGMEGIVREYERLKTRDAAKEYASIDNFNRAYTSIVDALEKNKTL